MVLMLQIMTKPVLLRVNNIINSNNKINDFIICNHPNMKAKHNRSY